MTLLRCADEFLGECSGGLVAVKKVSLAIFEDRVSGLYFLCFYVSLTHVCIICRGVTRIVLGRQQRCLAGVEGVERGGFLSGDFFSNFGCFFEVD